MKKKHVRFILLSLACFIALCSPSLLLRAQVVINTPQVDGVDLDALWTGGPLTATATATGTVDVFGAGGTDNQASAIYGGEGWNFTLAAADRSLAGPMGSTLVTIAGQRSTGPFPARQTRSTG